MKYKVGDKVGVIVDKQVTRGEVIRIKNSLFGMRFLVRYKTDFHNGAAYLRTENNVRWLSERKLI